MRGERGPGRESVDLEQFGSKQRLGIDHADILPQIGGRAPTYRVTPAVTAVAREASGAGALGLSGASAAGEILFKQRSVLQEMAPAEHNRVWWDPERIADEGVQVDLSLIHI